MQKLPARLGRLVLLLELRCRHSFWLCEVWASSLFILSSPSVTVLEQADVGEV